MQTIFVMVKCELGRAYDVADAAVQTIEAVSEVYSISGQYDLIMKFYLDDAGRHRPVRHQPGADPARREGHLHLITFKAFT